MNTKKQLGKRLLSIWLAVIMTVGLLPTTAFAATTRTVNSASELQSAISSAGNGDTIKLGANITFNSASQIRTVADAYQSNVILSYANLTYELTARYRIQRSATALGINFKWNDYKDWTAMTDYQLPEELRAEHTAAGGGNVKDLRVRNGKLADQNGNTLYVKEHGDAATYLLIDGKSLTIDLNGKTINATHNDAYFSALFVTGGANVTIKGSGGITSSNTAITANGRGTTVNIQGGSFSGYTAVAANDRAKVNITGGTFTGGNVTERVVKTTVSLDTEHVTTKTAMDGNYIWEGITLGAGYSYKKITEYRGTANRTINCATLYCGHYGVINVSGNPTVKAPSGGTLFYIIGSMTAGSTNDFGTYISGGTFEGQMKRGSACATGGYFSENPQGVITGINMTPSKDCMTGNTQDGKYEVISKAEWDKRGYVAAIDGGMYYDSLQKAINAAENGNTVRLLKDISGTQDLSRAKTYTLDLGGRTITGNVTVKSGNVTIKNGTISYTGTGNALKTEGNSASLTVNCTVNASKGTALSAGYGSSGGKVTTAGGTYTGGLGTAGGGVLSITGGKYSSDPTKYLPEGFSAKRGSDKYYTIQVALNTNGFMEIWTLTDLQGFATQVSDGNETLNAILMADIDLASISNWTPIGNSSNYSYYSGTFDGNGHSIKNLKITIPSVQGKNIGFFSAVSETGTIKNLRIASGTISGTNFRLGVGSIAGSNRGTIQNCSNAANISLTANSTAGMNFDSVGGIAGRGNGVINRCYNEGDISDPSNRFGWVCGIGGGGFDNRPTIKDCYNTGKITGCYEVHGIGYDNVSRCFNWGELVCQGDLTAQDAPKAYTIYPVSRGSGDKQFYRNTSGASGNTPGSAQAKSDQEFSSGAVAWLLNNESAWYQNLGSGGDPYPVLDPTHARAYQSGGTYTNYKYTSLGPIDNVTVPGGNTVVGIIKALPKTVAVNSTKPDGRFTAELSWDTSPLANYDPDNWDEQTFTIKGTAYVTELSGGGNKQVTVTVKVRAVTPCIVVDEVPTKLAYVDGDTLDLSGAKFALIYDDVHGTTVDIDYDAPGVSYTIGRSGPTVTHGMPLDRDLHEGSLVVRYGNSMAYAGDVRFLSNINTIDRIYTSAANHAVYDGNGGYTLTVSEGCLRPKPEDHTTQYLERIFIELTDRNARFTTQPVIGSNEDHWEITVVSESGIPATYYLQVNMEGWNKDAIDQLTQAWNSMDKTWSPTQAEVQQGTSEDGDDSNPSYEIQLQEWLIQTMEDRGMEFPDYVTADITFTDGPAWAEAGDRYDYHDGVDGSFDFSITFTAAQGGTDTHESVTFDSQKGIITATPYPVPDYTVSFDSQGGSDVGNITVKEDTPIGDAAPAAPTRAGYRFTGWYKEADCTTPWNMDEDKVTANPTTLYAGWSWSKTETTVDSIQHTATANPDAGDPATTIRVGDTISITATAKLSDGGTSTLEDNTGSFTFYNGDPANGGKPLGTAQATGSVEDGYTATLTDVELAGDKGFTGDGDYTIYAVFNRNDALDKSQGTEALTVKKAIYTVSFTGVEEPIDPQYIEDGGKITAPDPDPVKANYNFAGWYADKDHTTRWDFDEHTVTGPTTLYAGWTWRVTATTVDRFDRTAAANPAAGEGVEVIRMGDTISITASTGMTVPDGPAVLSNGDELTFTFYNGDPDNDGIKLGEITATPNSDGYTATLTGVVLTNDTGFNRSGGYTIYTVFSGNSNMDGSRNHKILTVAPAIFTVTFDSQNGSSVEPQYVVDGGMAAEPAQAPARSDYKFTGWYADGNGAQPWAFGSTAITGHTTIYAGWSWSKTETTIDSIQRVQTAEDLDTTIRVKDTISITASAKLADSSDPATLADTTGTFTFYNGDPDSGGTRIGTATATGSVAGGFTATLNVALTSENGFIGSDSYTIFAVFSGNDAVDKSTGSETLTVGPIAYPTPAAPQVARAAERSITLNVTSAPDHATVEYGYVEGTDGGTPSTWQASPVFTNLNPGTAYIFYVRFAANAYYAETKTSGPSAMVYTLPEITGSLPNGTLGVPYGATLTATPANVTWSVVGSLPYGLTLNDGTISGTPAGAGNFNFTVTVTTQDGITNSRQFAIYISPGTPDPGEIGTYLGDTAETTFTYGQTITVKGAIIPAASNSINLIEEPAQDQVALFYNGTQLTRSVTVGGDGSFILTYPTGEGGIPIGADQEITVRFGGSLDLNAAEIPLTITLNRASGPAFPATLTDAYDTDTDTTFAYTMPYVAGAEYKMDEGGWQPSNVFGGITPRESHTFYARMAETSTHEAGAETSTTVFFDLLENTTPIQLEVSVSGESGSRTVTIAPVTGAQYSFDGGSTWGEDNEKQLDSDAPITVAIRYKATDTHAASDALTEMLDPSKEPQEALYFAPIGGKTYGDASFTLSTSGGSGDGEVTYVSLDPGVISIEDNVATIHKAGSARLQATKAGDDQYNARTAETTVMVARKPLTITADNKQATVGNPMPKLTYTVSGLVNGDTFSPEPITSCPVTVTSVAGQYTISISGGTLTNGDSYDIRYQNGVLTIETVAPTIYTVIFNSVGGTLVEAQDIIAGERVREPAAPTREGYHFAGWYSDPGYNNAWSFSDPVTPNLILYAKWDSKPVYEIDGSVTGDGSAVGIEITLKRGNTIVYRTKTNGEGKYHFTHVAPGLYNIAAQRIVPQGSETVTQTVTILVEIVDSNAQALNIQMPPMNVNSVLKLPSNAPEIMVGGLNDEAVAEATGGGGVTTNIVTVSMEITPQPLVTGTPEPGKEQLQQEQNAIQQTAPGKTLNFMEFEVVKTVTPSTGGDPQKDTITETQNVLEIVVAFDFTSKRNVQVYRYHDGVAEALTPAAEKSSPVDGTYYLDSANGLIYIFAQKYSLYAIGYTVSTPSGGGGSGGGGGGDGGIVSTYSITIKDSDHGKVTSSSRSASSGSTITLTATPDEGYRLEEITVTDSRGRKLELTSLGSGKYSFKMPAWSVVVTAIFQEEAHNQPWVNPFTDVAEGAWYYDAVRFASENGLMGGYGNGLFGPNDNLSRAQFAQILFNKEGRPVVNYLMQFDDVANGAWYTEAIRWAASQGIVGGYGNGTFGPNDNITREQLAVMLWRYAGSPAATEKELHFTDADKASGYALEALRWAVENGVINGYGNGQLAPQGLATRAQVAQMLKNFIETQEENT